MTAELSAPTKRDFQLLIPLILVAFAHPSKVVRSAASACFSTLQILYQASPAVKDLTKKKDASSGYDLLDPETFYGSEAGKSSQLSLSETLGFLAVVTKFEGEMSLDTEHFEKHLAEFFGLRKGKISNREILAFLLDAIVVNEKKPSVQVRLLSILKYVDVPAKADSLRGVLASLLALNGTVLAENLVYAELLDLVLQTFTPLTAGHLDSTSELLSLLLQTLGSSTAIEGDKSVQLMSLKRITGPFFAAVPAGGQRSLFSKLCEIAVSTTAAVAKVVKSVVASITVHSSLLINEVANLQKSLKEVPPSPAKKRKTKSSESAGAATAKLNQEYLERLVVLLEMIEMKDEIPEPANLIPVLFDVLSEILNADSECASALKIFLLYHNY